MRITTVMTDEAWRKECVRRLDKALDEPRLAKKALEVLKKNPGLRKEIPKSLYFQVLISAR